MATDVPSISSARSIYLVKQGLVPDVNTVEITDGLRQRF
jgi:hypothetical protein